MNRLRNMMKRIKDQKGVTLIELLAVIVILGIIAAIAVPNILNLRNDSQTAVNQTNAKTMTEVAKRLILVNHKTYLIGAETDSAENFSFLNIATEAGLPEANFQTELTSGGHIILPLDETHAHVAGYYDLDPKTGDVAYSDADVPEADDDSSDEESN